MTNTTEFPFEVSSDLSIPQLLELLVELGREEYRLQQRELAVRARIRQLQEAQDGYFVIGY